MRLREGRAGEALAAAEQACALAPGSAAAQLQRGLALRELGRHEPAAAALEQAARLAPGESEPLLHLGLTWLAAGEPGRARAVLEPGARRFPGHAPLRLALALALLEGQAWDDAEREARAALAAGLDLADTHLALAGALAGQDRLGEALAACREARRREPGSPAALARLVELCLETGLHEEAEAALRAAIATAPGDPALRERLATVLAAAARLGEAEAELGEALRLAPERASAHHRLAEVRIAAGAIEEGLAACRRALELDPGLARAYETLALARRARPGDERWVERIEVELARPGHDDAERAALRFAAAKLLDDLGRPDAAFAHLARGNALVRRGLRHDPAAVRARVDALIAAFPRERFASPPPGDPSDLPVLVVGMPRSGTTLVERILAAHPQVHACGELEHLGKLRIAVDGVPYPACAGRLDAPLLAALARGYLEALAAAGAGPGVARAVDKMPLNFWHLGLVALALPRARVIHCTRDPRDTGLSIYFQNFTHAQANGFAFELGEIGAYLNEYRRLMAHWRAVLPLPWQEVAYESLVADPEGTARALIAFLGLPWDARCLDHRSAGGAVLTASQWQVRQPVYTRSVGRWRAYAAHLGPLLEALGPPAGPAAREGG